MGTFSNFGLILLAASARYKILEALVQWKNKSFLQIVKLQTSIFNLKFYKPNRLDYWLALCL